MGVYQNLYPIKKNMRFQIKNIVKTLSYPIKKLIISVARAIRSMKHKV